MTTTKYAPHIVATSALFTLGNAIVLMPMLNFFGVGISFILSLLIVWFVSFLLKSAQKNKVVSLCTTLVICIAAIYGAATTFLDYVRFLKSEQMPQTSIILLAITFAAIVVIFAKSKIHAIYKYSLFVFVVLVAIMLLSFMGGFKFFEYKNLNTDKYIFSAKEYIRFFSSIIVLSIVFKNDNQSIKPTICGVSVGFLFVFIALFQSVLTLGANADAVYPYLKSVGVISSGSLFTRLDGAVWFLFFVTSLIKIAVCIKVVKNSITQH